MRRSVVLRYAFLGGALVALAMQAVPYGRNHANPPVRQEPAWDSPRTRELTVRACYTCHSNETAWPWYASVAPVSWLAQYDVDEGRRELNFSEWNRRQKEAGEAAETVSEGEMPPWYFTALRSDVRLTAAEREALAQGLTATLGTRRRH
jgi:hypothetical protein